LLAACQAAEAPVPTLSATEFMGADEVETAAKLLALADNEGEGVSHRRAAAVQALDRLGVEVLEGTDEDPLAQWRAEVPDDPAKPLRGRLLGPAYKSGTLSPGEALSTQQLFDGGKQARVTLSGAQSAPLAVTVEDNSDRTICRTEPGNPRSCRWTPPFSSRYEIIVRNDGDKPTRYYLVIG
jgi:hypothetical protein